MKNITSGKNLKVTAAIILFVIAGTLAVLATRAEKEGASSKEELSKVKLIDTPGPKEKDNKPESNTTNKDAVVEESYD